MLLLVNPSSSAQRLLSLAPSPELAQGVMEMMEILGWVRGSWKPGSTD